MSPYSPHVLRVRALYRQALRTQQDWCSRHSIWRQQAIDIRYRFEDNRHLSNPRDIARVMQHTEQMLKDKAHPEPYRYPTSAEGSKYERNAPVRMELVLNGCGVEDYPDPGKEYGHF
ncbi:hypothetical protein RI367_000907 [Sorochytrium milnesiophthora]